MYIELLYLKYFLKTFNLGLYVTLLLLAQLVKRMSCKTIVKIRIWIIGMKQL